ncbi:MAG: DegV family EDD domain-containing protein [Xanthomonadales bacterium]|nr:DegV family EDD domain-containing protein [Xanthomonadales bacterium]
MVVSSEAADWQRSVGSPAGLSRGIGGHGLRRALLAGARAVQQTREHLNRINVFPVPDGDTGTNLAFTMEALAQELERLRSGNSSEVLAAAAQATLDGARGNSGAILAQFLFGLAEATRQRARLSVEQLGQAVAHAAATARAAIAEPREGTVISVIADFATALQQQAERSGRHWVESLDQALQQARRSLADTPNRLAVLRRAGVVDAGAQGFVSFVEGILDYVRRGREALASHSEDSDAQAFVPLSESHADSAYRYCTECLLEGEQLDAGKVRQALAELPMDSLVVVGGGAKLRLHAHLDQPGLLFDRLSNFGLVSQRKADDMQAQQRARQRLSRIAIVTDSAADLPEEERQRLGIQVVPVRVVFGEADYLDKITLSPSELYARMRAGEIAKTSQPPAIDFRRQFELLCDHHEAVLCIGLSSQVSGTWQAACHAAARFGDRIQVLDSLNVSSGQALLALYAAEAAQQGLQPSQVIEATQAMLPRTRTYGLLADLRYGARGGRIPAWLAPVGRWIGGYLRVENSKGRIRPRGLHLGTREQAAGRFVRRIAHAWRGTDHVRAIVAHCDAEAEARQALAALRGEIPGLSGAWIVECGPALGAHAGPGSIVVGLQAWRPPA